MYVYLSQGEFVAAFAQSNEGDVSPNTKGAHCLDTGLPCEFNHSTCNGKVGVVCIIASLVYEIFLLRMSFVLHLGLARTCLIAQGSLERDSTP